MRRDSLIYRWGCWDGKEGNGAAQNKPLKADENAPDGEFQEREMRATPGLVVPEALKLYVHCPEQRTA